MKAMYDETKGISQYEDIINLPHHVSKKRPQMSIADRAAQFSPFAALVGHGEAVAETARLTEQKIELDENAIEVLNDKLQQISDNLTSCPLVEFTYFLADERKQGGAYVTINDKVKKFDSFNRTAVLEGGTVIPIDDIIDIEFISEDI